MKLVTIDIETLNGWPEERRSFLPPEFRTDNFQFNGLNPAVSTPTSVQLSGGDRDNVLIEVGPVHPIPERGDSGLQFITPDRQVREEPIGDLGTVTTVVVSSTAALLDEVKGHLSRFSADGYRLLVGWNSGVFDLPFLAHTHTSTFSEEPAELTLRSREDREPKYERLPSPLLPVSNTGVYAARYRPAGMLAGELRHLDAYVYKAWCATQTVKWSLKPTLEARGYGNPTNIDRTRLHEADAATRRLYAMWDVVGLHRMVTDDWWANNDIFGFEGYIDPTV